MDKASLKFKFITRLPYLLIFGFCVYIFFPFIAENNWFKSHDGTKYFYLFFEFKETFLNGKIYPRWQANMYGGFGYPSFIFYQPGYFYLLLLISFLFKNMLHTFIVSLIVLFTLSGIGAYKLARQFCDRFVSLFIAMIYLSTPYIYVNLFVRGDLSELCAMLLSPWPFYLLFKIEKKYKDSNVIVNTLLLAVFLSAIIVSHPATTLFFIPIFSFFCLLNSIRGKNINFALFKYYCIAISLSVLLSSPYWVTIFALKSYASFDSITSYWINPSTHVIYWKQFFSPFWGFKFSLPGTNDGVSFHLGTIHFILSLFGFLLCRKNKMIAASFILYLILIWLMSPMSTYVWKTVPIIGYLQFPWRLLSVTSSLQLLCLCGLGVFFRNKKQVTKILILLIILSLSLFVQKSNLPIFQAM